MRKIESKSLQELLEEEESPKVPTIVPPKEEPKDLALSEAFDSIESTLAPTREERRILEGAIKGTPINTLAINVGVPPAYIRNYLRNPKVKEYLKELRLAVNEIDQMLIAETLRKTLGARIDEVEENGGNYAALTNKDTLDIIRAFADFTSSTAKNAKEEKSDDIFVNIYQQIIE